jgi:hypothetical protein
MEEEEGNSWNMLARLAELVDDQAWPSAAQVDKWCFDPGRICLSTVTA